MRIDRRLPERRALLASASAAAAAGAAAACGFHWLRRWGTTDDEHFAVLPGDDLSPDAAVIHTRAITIDAEPSIVWRWLMQVGQDRSGFFSYTLLENLVGCKMPRVHELRADWATREPEDLVWMATPSRFNSAAYNVVARSEPERELVLVSPIDPDIILRGGEARWVWQFVLVPSGDGGSTRLIVRSRYLSKQYWLEPIHFVMERKMMKTIAQLAADGSRRGVTTAQQASSDSLPGTETELVTVESASRD